MVRPVNRGLASLYFVLCDCDHSGTNLVIAGTELAQWNVCVQDHPDQLLCSSCKWLAVSNYGENDRVMNAAVMTGAFLLARRARRGVENLVLEHSRCATLFDVNSCVVRLYAAPYSTTDWGGRSWQGYEMHVRHRPAHTRPSETDQVDHFSHHLPPTRLRCTELPSKRSAYEVCKVQDHCARGAMNLTRLKSRGTIDGDNEG